MNDETFEAFLDEKEETLTLIGETEGPIAPVFEALFEIVRQKHSFLFLFLNNIDV